MIAQPRVLNFLTFLRSLFNIVALFIERVENFYGKIQLFHLMNKLGNP